MPTSELSDALNPYYAQPRSRTAQQRQQQAPQQAPHRSELELAISEPPATPSTPISSHSPARPTNPHNGGIHAVQELLRFLATTREAQEIEHRRRIAWEQEQEAKYRLRQAEMERRMLEMQQEITALKTRVAHSSATSPSLVGASVNVHSNPIVSQHLQLEYSYSSPQQPTPSTSPTLSHPSTPMMHPSTGVCPSVAGPSRTSPFDSAEASTTASYLASPSLAATHFVNVNRLSALGTAKERSVAELNDDDELYGDDDAMAQYRVRRKNHHDKRCLTIQHAMRNHLLRVMMLETDKELPDSHVEGTRLGPDEPVRFVWDKTPRQSVHNGRMKERVLKDLKANRNLYKHVPDKDFGKKALDAVFDQAFVTLRQKFRAQRDESAARVHRRREELKAQRARRVSRRKVKLANRSDARNKMSVFEHVTFDGALQLECMSSEESESEEEAETGMRTTVFRIRGVAWRSLRLQRFFDALDEGDKMDNAQRPRRGVGRRERFVGPMKEGTVMPPKGVSRWMVSKRWPQRDMVVVEEGGGGEEELCVLGEESDIPTV